MTGSDTGGTRPLVERDEALHALADACRDARAGRPSVTVVRGPAGMGKSALLRHAVARARRAGLVVGEVSGLEVEAELPFALASRLLRPVVARTRGRCALFDGAAASARAVIDDGAAAVATPALTVALAHVVERLAAEAPLALVVDDAQWSDPASLGLLRYVAARADRHRLAIVVATRPLDAAADEVRREVDALAQLAPTAAVDLPPLSVGGVARLLRAEVGPVDATTAASCAELTGGNPFFVLEVAGELRDERAPAHVVVAALPTVERRLGGLSSAARSLARAAAVLGDEFDVDCAAAVADLDAEGARSALTELRHAAVVDGHRPSFAHSLVARAVRSSTTPDERATAHARAARVLQGDGAHPIVVAKHLLETAPAGDDATVDALVDAAALARRAGQPRLARSFADRAAAELAPASSRGDAVERERARSAAAAGDGRWRDHAAAVVARVDADEGCRLLEVIGRELYSASHIAEAEAAYAWALELAGDTPDAALRLLARYVHAVRVQVDRPADRLDLLDRLEAAVKSYAERDAVEWREAAGCLAYQRAITGAPAARVDELATAALDPALVTDVEILHPITYTTALQAASMVGADIEVGATEHALAVCERVGLPAVRQSLLAYRGVRRLRELRVDDAITDLEEAAQLGALSPVMVPKLAAELALAHYEKGSLRAAWACVDVPDAEAYDATGYFNGYLRVRGVLRAARGEVAGAIDDLLRCGDRETQVLAGRAVAIPWAFDVAPLLVDVGRADDARVLLDRALDAARAQGVAFRVAHGLRAAAALSLPDTAEPLLREALDVLDGSPWRLERAEVELALARVLVETRRCDEAAPLLRTIVDAAHRGGAGRLAQSALALLRTTGARPRRLALTGHDALTRAERAVVALAAEGLSNRDIADERGVSTKAIEHHLSNAYRKLGVRSRVELMARKGGW